MKRLAIVFSDPLGKYKQAVEEQSVKFDEIVEVTNFAEANQALEKRKDQYDVTVVVRDLLYHNYTEETEKPILDWPDEVGAVYADSKHVFRPGYYVVALNRWNYQLSSLTINKHAFEVGLFDPNQTEPLQEFLMRVTNKGVIYHIPHELSC